MKARMSPEFLMKKIFDCVVCWVSLAIGGLIVLIAMHAWRYWQDMRDPASNVSMTGEYTKENITITGSLELAPGCDLDRLYVMGRAASGRTIPIKTIRIRDKDFTEVIQYKPYQSRRFVDVQGAFLCDGMEKRQQLLTLTKG